MIRTFIAYPDKNARVTITAQLRDLGQGPYFSMTFEEYERRERGRWRFSSGGSGVEAYAAHFPELVPFFRWHLVSVNTGPLFYVANALYWAGLSGYCNGKPNDPPSWENLLSTIIWGEAPTDAADFAQLQAAYNERDAAELRSLLAARLPALMVAFDDAMRALFGAEYVAPKR